MNAKKKIEELLEASEDGTITAAQVTEAGLHRNVLQEFLLLCSLQPPHNYFPISYRFSIKRL